MIYLRLQNIAEDGEMLEEKREAFDSVVACIDRIDELIDQDPQNIYASPKYMNWVVNKNSKLLTPKEMGMFEQPELVGTTGWEIRGVLNGDGDDRAILVAEYLGSIVESEVNNAKKKKKIRLSKAAKKRLRDNLKTKWQ